MRAFRSFHETCRLAGAVERDDPAAEVIPGTRPASAELLFMIPKGTLQRFATVDHSRANVIVRTGAVGSAAMREVVSAIWNVIDRSELARHFSVQLTGNAILLNRCGVELKSQVYRLRERKAVFGRCGVD